MIKNFFLILGLYSIISGCTLGGDVGFMVKGEVLNTESEQQRNCNFHIFQHYSKWDMDVEFTNSFDMGFIVYATVFSRKEPVSFSITCDDGSYYNSPIYMLGIGSYTEYPEGSIDLGTIELESNQLLKHY